MFLLDCTYKTNKFGLPLLNVVGLSSVYKTFTACFVFLRSETVEDYAWALERFRELVTVEPQVLVTDRELALMNAIQDIFPKTKNLICVWHIMKNITARCKKEFKDEEVFELFLKACKGLIYAATEEDFESSWSQMKKNFAAYTELLGYIDRTWLSLKEHFIAFWADQDVHFGHSYIPR